MTLHRLLVATLLALPIGACDHAAPLAPPSGAPPLATQVGALGEAADDTQATATDDATVLVPASRGDEVPLEDQRISAPTPSVAQPLKVHTFAELDAAFARDPAMRDARERIRHVDVTGHPRARVLERPNGEPPVNTLEDQALGRGPTADGVARASAPVSFERPDVSLAARLAALPPGDRAPDDADLAEEQPAPPQ